MKSNLIGTYGLFFQSLYFIVIACVLVFLILFMSNRSKKHHRTRYIAISCFFILLLIGIRFILSLVFREEQIKLLVFMELVCILCILYIQLIYYAKDFFFILVITFIGILTTGFHFFNYIGPDQIVITPLYRGIIYYFIFILSLLSIYDTNHNIKKRERLSYTENTLLESIGKYQLYEAVLINGGLLLALILFMNSMVKATNIPLADFGIITYITLVFITFLFFMPQVKIPLGYRQIVSNMMDTIMILDEKNVILYVNETQIKSYFSLEKKLEFNLLSIYVNQPNCTSKLLDDNQIQLCFQNPEVEQKVLIASRKVIYRKNKIVGYVINISDCTHLEAMIQEKEKQKNDLDGLKLELTKYSQTSKFLLAENQRNRLLVEVQNELGHYMAELAKHISSILHLVEDDRILPETKQPRVHESIELGISMAKSNLTKIRETVKKYRSSYDEKKE